MNVFVMTRTVLYGAHDVTLLFTLFIRHGDGSTTTTIVGVVVVSVMAEAGSDPSAELAHFQHSPSLGVPGGVMTAAESENGGPVGDGALCPEAADTDLVRVSLPTPQTLALMAARHLRQQHHHQQRRPHVCPT